MPFWWVGYWAGLFHCNNRDGYRKEAERAPWVSRTRVIVRAREANLS